MNIIEKILSPPGRRINEAAPMVDARLADGSRVNIIIPPLALDGSMVTIRKFSKSALTVQDLINFGTPDERMAKSAAEYFGKRRHGFGQDDDSFRPTTES